MKKTQRSRASVVLACACMCLSLGGCGNLRFAPDEMQKQNAWLHNRTAIVAAETARAEDASQTLQALTQLNEVQSRAFSSYCGLPDEFPRAETAEDILAESNWQLAAAAVQASAERPDEWRVADSMLEIGIGICAVLGGVGGARAVRLLKDTRTKSQALREVIAGNELFKKQNQAHAAAFKQAQSSQSPETRQLVAQMKA